MFRRLACTLIAIVSLLATPTVGVAAQFRFEPGAPGVGDPYFPLDGNGGYDVQHYLLDVSYTPQTDVLAGSAVITARATQNLSRFNLDLQGMTVRSITVDGRPATWSRSGDELTVTPRSGVREGRLFHTTVSYDGIPEPPNDPDVLGTSGFMHTDDGAVVAGEPHVATTWFPVNDHPSDKASFTFKVRVPAGLKAISNGVLVGNWTHDNWATWVWHASEPMAPYLATATIGKFDLNAYRANGVHFWDAIDSDLLIPLAPRTGEQFALSNQADSSYKRLSRTISVPAAGAQMSFWIDRITEQEWDFVFVEAHTAGADDWTTLPDRNGHTTTSMGNSCPGWLELHPFLTHYQTDRGNDPCAPTGSTGAWNAASGSSSGYQQWTVDLAAYAGRDVELSISYVSDDIIQMPGVVVDDITVSTGAGTTSFENDGDTMDGWTVAGAPPGSALNANDWTASTASQAPTPEGSQFQLSLARQPEMLGFLSGNFGPYPFNAGGGILDDTTVFGFALENQTRPIYPRSIATNRPLSDRIMVHELAHQWYGDSLTVAKWQHIWLNEGFARYSEWLWSEREGIATAQQLFDAFYNSRPPTSPFWQVVVGDPGPQQLFNIAIYDRGAMTLHQLRLAVGDEKFFKILRQWATEHAGGNVTTDQFIALAERISGQNLDQLFTTWLFTPQRPVVPVAADQQIPAAALSMLEDHKHGGTRPH